jgi:N-acetylmuramoyl-L-alanine amidase
MVVSMAFILLQQDFTIVDNKTIDELTVVSVEEYYSPVETPIDVLTELKIVKEEATEDDLYLSDEEINLIALVTMAEAEGECEEGKKLVIDTILNRVDSEYFPDNVNDVVYQTNQFSSVGN